MSRNMAGLKSIANTPHDTSTTHYRSPLYSQKIIPCMKLRTNKTQEEALPENTKTYKSESTLWKEMPFASLWDDS